MHSNLALCTKRTRMLNAVAAGQTTQTPTAALDMEGFDGAQFILALGTISASGVCTLKAQGSNNADGSSGVDLVGATVVTTADTDDNKLLVLDVFRPIGYRYLIPVVSRTGGNVVIDSLVGIQYGTVRKQPTSDDATTVAATTQSIEPQASDSSKTQTTTTYSGCTTAVSTTARTSS